MAAALFLGLAAGPADAASCPLLPGSSCHHANLDGADLHGRDLRRIDLTSASLRGANLTDAKLNNAILKHADLRGAHLQRVNLTDANLQEANLEHISLEGTSAVRADFRHAKLRGVVFDFGDVQQAQFGSADAPAASFHKAKIQHANFNHTELHGAGFTNATFGGTNFANSKVEHIRLFPSNVGDDATARGGLFFYVYLHLDAYSGHGFCNDTDGGGRVFHTSRSIYCMATGDGATTIPAFRGGSRQWGWHDYGHSADITGAGHATISGSFDAPHFTLFNVKHTANLGIPGFWLPTGNGAKGHPGGPFSVELTSRTYNPQGSFQYGYILRMSGYLQRSH